MKYLYRTHCLQPPSVKNCTRIHKVCAEIELGTAINEKLIFVLYLHRVHTRVHIIIIYLRMIIIILRVYARI